MPSRRVLITGLSTYWGGRLAQELETDETIETIIGVDRTPPKVELRRAEFVQVADSHSLIRRIVDAAGIDTLVDTRLVVDSIVTTPGLAHENNAIGTLNVLAACNGPDSPVRKVVFKSSAHYYGSEQDDPAFFTEDMVRPQPPRTALERDIVDAERSVGDFAARHPDVTVTVLRFANGLGPDLRTSWSRLFALPVVPMILGFDPRLQFIHEDDIVGSLEHAVRHDIDGVHNCAADGVLALSEVAGLLGKSYAPVLPPWGTRLAAAVAGRLGVRIPPEMLQQMRFGRGLDNRRFKATGYRYRQTTREAVIALGEHQRLQPLLRGAGDAYRYERELEDFLRYSPSVRAESARAEVPSAALEAPRARPAEIRSAPAYDDLEAPRARPAESRSAPAYDDLRAEEVIALLPSLDAEALRVLHAHEAAHRGRRTVIRAIERLQRWEAPP
jgi:UDP-glucose 4-epimerase